MVVFDTSDDERDRLERATRLRRAQEEKEREERVRRAMLQESARFATRQKQDRQELEALRLQGIQHQEQETSLAKGDGDGQPGPTNAEVKLSSGSLSLPTAPAIASPICGPIVMKDVPRAARAKQNPIWGARKPTISPQPTSPAPAPVLAPSVHGFPSGRRRRPGGQTRNSNVDPRNFIPLGRRTSPCCAAKGDAPVPPSSTAAARGAKPVVTPPCHPVPKATALPLVRPPEAAVRQACQPVERCFLCHTLLQQHARLLPCGHGFHRKCIQEWGEEDADCPVCCTRTTAVLAEIRGMFRRGHLPEMRDDVSSGASECMEAGFEEMMAEERHSRHVGHREDREEWRRTLAEEAEEAALRKRLRRR